MLTKKLRYVSLSNLSLNIYYVQIIANILNNICHINQKHDAPGYLIESTTINT